jgi:predicted nucleotidyltransferase
MLDESSSSVRVIWLDREAAREAVREAARRVMAERPEVRRIVLFGSLARGDAVPGSDADVLMVADTEARVVDRADPYVAYFRQPHVGVEVFVYTPEEIARLAEQPGLVRTALQEGIVLAERCAD